MAAGIILSEVDFHLEVEYMENATWFLGGSPERWGVWLAGRKPCWREFRVLIGGSSRTYSSTSLVSATGTSDNLI